MHNNPEYASTASISTVMTMPLHVKPFEKKIFKEVIFLLKYQQNPQVLKRRSIEKKREKSIQKKKKKEKRGRKRKAPRVSSNKGKVNILRGEKNTSTSKFLFDVTPFSPPPSQHFRNPFQNHWKSFLNSFWTILLLGNIYDLSYTLSSLPMSPTYLAFRG
jgi:hypothetical protein